MAKTNKPKRPSAYDKARACGMTIVEWQGMRQQVGQHRSHGHRPKGTAKKLDDWGDCPGQMSMFEE